MLAGVVTMLALSIRPSSAAVSLALHRSDYPKGSRIVVLPATNAEADLYFHPVHHSTFERLHRVDAAGWLQAAVWSFKTGRGKAIHHHRVVFAYAINVFKNAAQAQHALNDVNLRLHRYHVGHELGRAFRRTTASSSVMFIFARCGSSEIETYYEYTGVAPASIARKLRHTFDRQGSHLVHTARALDQARHAPAPTDTPTAIPTATPTGTAVPTATATATSTPTATAPPTATATSTATPTPTTTPTPAGLVITASPDALTYAPGDSAAITVHITNGGQPVAGAYFVANFAYQTRSELCSGTTTSDGTGHCSTVVPDEDNGTIVQVSVAAQVSGNQATATTSFKIEPDS